MSSAVPGAAPNLVALRDQLRLDLRDSPADRWTDAALERHIVRAVAEFSQAYPDPQATTLTTTPGSRDVSIATLADLIRIEAVEYPIAEYPRSFAAWQAWQTTLTLLVETAPATAESLVVYWGKLHACTTAACTVSAPDLDLVLTGAAGFAAREWATYATNRTNVDREAVERYERLAAESLSHFHTELARRPRTARLAQRWLRRPAEQLARGNSVVGL